MPEQQTPIEKNTPVRKKSTEDIKLFYSFNDMSENNVKRIMHSNFTALLERHRARVKLETFKW